MNIVIVKDDAIPEALEELLPAHSHGGRYRVVLLSRFIAMHGLQFDEASGRFLGAGDNGGEALADVDLVVDRVVEVSRQTCVAVAGAGIQPPARGQLLQAYQSLLARYRRPRAGGECYSTVGTLVPLFAQWAIVRRMLPWLRVPEYKYGYGPEPVDAGDFLRPIYKTPFDFYDWRPNRAPEGIPNDRFVVERPAGDPTLTFFCGHRAATRALTDSDRIDASMALRLADATTLLADRFGAWMGEVLWFVDGDSIVFAAFSHRLDAGKRFPELFAMFEQAIADRIALESGAA